MPGYKPYFKFKSKMQTSMRQLRTLLLLLFKLVDEVMRVKMEVNNTLYGYGADVIGEEHKEACFTITGRDQLDLSDLNLDQDNQNKI